MAFFSYSLGPIFPQRPVSLALVRRAGGQQEVFRLSVSAFEGHGRIWTSFLCMPTEEHFSDTLHFHGDFLPPK